MTATVTPMTLHPATRIAYALAFKMIGADHLGDYTKVDGITLNQAATALETAGLSAPTHLDSKVTTYTSLLSDAVKNSDTASFEDGFAALSPLQLRQLSENLPRDDYMFKDGTSNSMDPEAVTKDTYDKLSEIQKDVIAARSQGKH